MVSCWWLLRENSQRRKADLRYACRHHYSLRQIRSSAKCYNEKVTGRSVVATLAKRDVTALAARSWRSDRHVVAVGDIAARVALPTPPAHRLGRIHDLVRLAEVVEDVVFFDPLDLADVSAYAASPFRQPSSGYRRRGLPMRAIVGFPSLTPLPPHHSHILSRKGRRLGTRPVPRFSQWGTFDDQFTGQTFNIGASC
jgi:hypothetical protein